MTPVEIARRLAGLGQIEKACQAYTLVIHQNQSVEPAEELEAAVYLFQFGTDYKVPYTSFVSLYNRGHFKETILPIMTQAFLEPNEKLLKSRYEKNCRRLGKYPYIFKKDFLPFEELPIRFFPYDNNGYLPFNKHSKSFGEYVNPRHPVVSRNFFKDLENPILAADVFSQYELEYLYDNVRKSEWAARDNHIYLHFTDWTVFCSWLQVLNLRPVLEDKKIVFLIEDEIGQYPIDFKKRFGLDYGQFPLKPLGIREVTRLIWNCQLSSHNGIDFFNEVLDDHPNLLCSQTLLFDEIIPEILKAKEKLTAPGDMVSGMKVNGREVNKELFNLVNPSQKDVFVAMLMSLRMPGGRDIYDSRIAPALVFQPHFKNIYYSLGIDAENRAELYSMQYEAIRQAGIFDDFKYIKTFSPLRRITTSHAAALKYMHMGAEKTFDEEEKGHFIPDAVCQRVLTRNYLADPDDRLFKDSVIVRFEDGKLNPKATFSALAAFLDLPYAESMTYCSSGGERDPETLTGHARGFDPAPVFRTYDDYINREEGFFIEYFMEDAYRQYGYDFKYYDGSTMDERRAEDLISHFDCCNQYIFESWERTFKTTEWKKDGNEVSQEELEKVLPTIMDMRMKSFKENRVLMANNLLKKLRFVGKNGQPLRMLPLLKLDPALLEQPLYR